VDLLKLAILLASEKFVRILFDGDNFPEQAIILVGAFWTVA